MPSKNPTLRVVVSESEKTVIEAMAKAVGKSVSTFLKDLALGSQPSHQVSQPVCVLAKGAKLTTEYELKPHLTEIVLKRQWYIFSEARIVAVKNKSANGAKSWLEVAVEYPESVWVAASKDRDYHSLPLDTLRVYQGCLDRSIKFEQIPKVAEALQRGWQYEWVRLKSDEMEQLLTAIAAQYLNNLPIAEVQPVSTVDGVPSTLTKDALAARLAPKHLELSNAKSAKAKDRVIADLPLVLNDMKEKTCTTWTSARDIEGYAWLPVDATREEWARQLKPA
ncbi:MAG: hypothetical protein V7K35_12390 [Nostoc sp.]|uniref:plasmid mobilization protein n=1 Tax=Nostoc sp. TaxID=1180 RepID=UPI002FFBA232